MGRACSMNDGEEECRKTVGKEATRKTKTWKGG
jgi:hypothetical protein